MAVEGIYRTAWGTKLLLTVTAVLASLVDLISLRHIYTEGMCTALLFKSE